MSTSNYPRLALLVCTCCIGFSAEAEAQGACTIGDDGYQSLPCCNNGFTLNIPGPMMFSCVSTSGKYAVISQCGLTIQEFNVMITVGNQINNQLLQLPALITTPACDEFVIPITIDPQPPFLEPTMRIGTGGSGPDSELYAKYARTFFDFSIGAPGRQVWRYIVSGRFSFSNIPANSAATPGCFQFIPPTGMGLPQVPSDFEYVPFFGHLDIFDRNGAGGCNDVGVALSLHHMAGCLGHGGNPTLNRQQTYFPHNSCGV